MRKLWAWGCLTTAAVLALVLGEHRVSEAVALDSDNLVDAR